VPALFALTLLSACGPTAWEDREQAWRAGPGATATTGFPLVDGTYKGDVQLLSATGPDCPLSRSGIITIGDNRLVYSSGTRQNFVALIAADGTIRGHSGTAALEGRVGNGDLAFTIRSATCESRYALRWVM
jgi:hypothetical protein